MKYKFLSLIPVLLFTFSCGGQETITPPPAELTEEEKYQAFKEKIYVLSEGASKCNSDIVQTDSYGGIEIEVKNESETILYQDNFKRERFINTLSDDVKSYGTKETGITSEDPQRLYQICDFDEDSSSDTVAFLKLSDENKKINLDVGFSYLMNTAVFLPYESAKNDTSTTYSFQFNFFEDEVNLEQDGKTELYFKTIAKREGTILQTFEFGAIITIKEQRILKADVTMKNSILEDTNWQFSEGTHMYSYDILTEYNDAKLDYNSYNEAN